MKNLCILGSTGSIGTQTVEILRAHGGYRVLSLAAKENIDKLEEQIRELKPERACVFNEELAAVLRERVKDVSVKIVAGMEGLLECAGDERNDMTVTAMVGMIGILPTIAAIKAGSDIALANKETLVTAGSIIMPLVKEYGVRLLPVDSEHSAIFQSLQGVNGFDGYYNKKNDIHGYIDKLLLTASGGPFRGKKYEELQKMTAADALCHPNWSMGKKITIDSATMVNKALELMEARWLFDVEPDDIMIVIQPKSIIHSAVQFKDGSIIAQLGVPDMKLPIQYALYYPERKPMENNKLDLFELASIALEKPDYEVFRGLKLGVEVAGIGGSVTTVYNAANEFAVAKYLEGSISFTDIYDIIEKSVRQHVNIQNPGLEDILETERKTRAFAAELIMK